MKTRLAFALVWLAAVGCVHEQARQDGTGGSGGSSSSGGAGSMSKSGGVSGSGGRAGGSGGAEDGGASQSEAGPSASGGSTGSGGGRPSGGGSTGSGGHPESAGDAGATDGPFKDTADAAGLDDADSIDTPPHDAGDAAAEAGPAPDAGTPDVGTPDVGPADASPPEAGTSGDPKAAASVLDGFAIVKPCPASFRPSGNANDGTTCEETADTENQHITKQFGGDSSVTYNVKLRIAGVSERYWYEGGTLDTTSKLFYTGGLPTIHGPAPNTNLRPGQGACKIHPPDTDSQYKLPFTVPMEIRPSDGCYNGFNIFAMTVSSPKQSYYLNYTTDFDNVDRQPHKTYMADYTVTIPIAGQATVQFFTIDGDHHQVANNGSLKVSNVKTAQPFTGNFLELTVVDVTRAN